jgi:hypothetical protein
MEMRRRRMHGQRAKDSLCKQKVKIDRKGKSKRKVNEFMAMRTV